MSYITIKTTAGLSLEAAADTQGRKIVLTHLALGDGGGADYTPAPDQTALRHETARVSLNALAQAPDDPTQWKAEGIFNTESGGYTIREAGLFTEDGTLFAVANLPSVYKPTTGEGAAGQLAITLNFKTANASTIQLLIDPNTAVATRTYVQEQVGAERQRAQAEENRKLVGDDALGRQDIRGRGVHTNNSGPKPLAQYSDTAGNNFPLARADDLTAETSARQAADIAEASARQDADSQLVSGTYGRAPGDAAGVALHTNHSSQRPNYTDSTGKSTDLPFMSDVANEAQARSSADSNLQNQINGKQQSGLYLRGDDALGTSDIRGRGVHTNNSASKPYAQYTDEKGNNFALARADDVSAEMQTRAAADTALANSKVAGDQGLDSYSLKITGIKSQYVDTAKTRHAGIEYIDAAGRYMLCPSKDLADSQYASQSALAAEASARQDADSHLVSGTAARGPHDPAGTALHTNSLTDRATYWDSTGQKGDLAYFADVQNETNARSAAENNLQNQINGKQAAGLYLRGDDALGTSDIRGRGVHTNNSASKPYAQYTDEKGNNFALARADDVSAEVQTRAAADTALANSKVAGDQGLDSYSLKITGIKSQYVDTARSRHAGIEYIDAAGRYMLCPSKDLADSQYASQNALAAEAAARQDADSQLISGTSGRAPGDAAGIALHTNHSSQRPNYTDSTGKSTDLPFMSDVANEAQARATADSNLQNQINGKQAAGLYLRGDEALGRSDIRGRGMHTNNAGAKPLAQYLDDAGNNFPLARADDLSNETQARQAADAAEASARQDADSQLISGTAARGPNDPAGTALHTDSGTGRPSYWDSTGQKGDLAYFADVQNETNARTTADSNLQNQINGKQAAGDYLVGNIALGPNDIGGRGVHTNNSGSKPLAQYLDEAGNNFALARADDLTAETSARQSADAAEASARQDADSQLVSGTYGRAPGDAAGVALHTNHTSGNPYYGDSNGHGGDLAYYSQLSALIGVLTQRPVVCTSGGTITVPAGVGHVVIEFTGGGGAGSNTNKSGGGGSSAAYAKIMLPLSPNSQFSVVIGGGGTGNSGNGGATRLSFGGAWIEAGGGGGAPIVNASSSPGGIPGSVSYGGGFDPSLIILAASGNCGSDGMSGHGNGAPGFWGGAGRAGNGGGINATGYGAGGGGAYNGGDGGSGSQGVAIIRWLP